jgi:hypothetical protein
LLRGAKKWWTSQSKRAVRHSLGLPEWWTKCLNHVAITIGFHCEESTDWYTCFNKNMTNIRLNVVIKMRWLRQCGQHRSLAIRSKFWWCTVLPILSDQTSVCSKQVGISKKCTLKEFLSNSKEKNKLKILQFLSNLKEKNKIAFNFQYAIKKLNFLVVIQDKKNSYITTKKYSVLIAYKFDKNCKIFNLFSSFE